MDTINRWPDSKSWSQVYEDSNAACINQYQTTPLRWKPPTPKDRSSDEIEFVIGTDDCVGSSIGYCNGPLKPGNILSNIVTFFI